MIKQAEKSYAPAELERQVQEFWTRAKVYPKTVAARERGAEYYFGDGPPFTTGSIHLGQVLNKTIKDAIVRYRRMRGFHVRDQPGYDMHGLPIEVQVEKTLGITNKKEIEDLGIAKFIDTCRTFSLDLLKKMTEQFQSLGVWLDWDRPYMTIRNEYIESAWWTLKRAHELGLLYEALRSIQWCTRDETSLADAEVEYADETDSSVARTCIRSRRGSRTRPASRAIGCTRSSPPKSSRLSTRAWSTPRPVTVRKTSSSVSGLACRRSPRSTSGGTSPRTPASTPGST